MSHDDAAELHRRAKEVFFRLMSEPSEDHERLLAELCSGDDALRREVSSLLGHQHTDTSHLLPEITGEAGAVPFDLSSALYSELAGRMRSDQAAEPADARSRRFASGDLFANRFQMHERLGSGGMGEVWRARDLMLGETVALKFVRSHMRGSIWKERLLQEAARARRVSHKNVCRVYDAGEAEGELFLSMEFVAGRDLSAELKLHGRLGARRSRQLAREIVDALAAVHRIGLLHRDLKPANILLDDDGTARVSDFGLAISSAESSPQDAGSGTRAYMAPEQLGGGAPSEASDIHALGLVLYEACCNRRAFRSGDEIVAAAEEGLVPVRPSVLVADVDAVLEHIILRCLAVDPRQRPDAAELQRALSIEDPLDAVLSLGDVPSAEVIAGSRSRAPLGATHARVLVAVVLGALLLSFVVVRGFGVHVLPERGPSELAEEARVLLGEIGVVPAGAEEFEAYGYQQDPPAYERSGHELLHRPGSDAADLHYWYRSAPGQLSPVTADGQLFHFGRVRPFDPPMGEPGASTVVFDRSGQLVFLDTRARAGREPVLGVEELFERAGLDRDSFAACEPLPARAAQADAHSAWRELDGSTRVEVATRTGCVVAFEVLTPSEGVVSGSSFAATILAWNALLVALLFVATLPRALRHFRSGRGDPTISMRVALTGALTLLATWLLQADQPTGSFERFTFSSAGLFACASSGLLIWILAVAIEPSLQRDWPRILVGWSRFFRGHVHGSGVRSELLVGMALGVLLIALQPLIASQAAQLVSVPALLLGFEWPVWSGMVVECVPSAILLCFEFVGVLVVLGWVLRSKRAAVVGLWAVACVLGGGAVDSFGATVLEVVRMTLILVALLQYGMLSAFALIVSREMLNVCPLSPSADAWYVQGSNVGLALFLVTLVWVAWPLMTGRRGAGVSRASAA